MNSYSDLLHFNNYLNKNSPIHLEYLITDFLTLSSELRTSQADPRFINLEQTLLQLQISDNGVVNSQEIRDLCFYHLPKLLKAVNKICKTCTTHNCTQCNNYTFLQRYALPAQDLQEV